TSIDSGQWWQGSAWLALPAQRNERDADLRWPLDLQVAGSLQPLREALQAHGWREQPQADWIATLGLLDDDLPAAQQPVLPATLDAEAEVLLLRRPTASPDQVLVLRLWRAPAHLSDGTPLWLGTAQVMQHTRPFDLFALWQPAADHGMAHAAVREALRGLATRNAQRGDLEVIRVDLRP